MLNNEGRFVYAIVLLAVVGLVALCLPKGNATPGVVMAIAWALVMYLMTYVPERRSHRHHTSVGYTRYCELRALAQTLQNAIDGSASTQIANIGVKRYKKETFYHDNLLVYKLTKIVANKPVVLAVSSNFQYVLDTVKKDSAE